MSLMFGEKVLSDFEPALGRIVHVDRHDPENIKVEIFETGNIVIRNRKCLFLVANKGRATKKAMMNRGSLRAKAISIPLSGHTENRRSGSIIVREWHAQYTSFGHSHIGPRINYELYAIIIDDTLVYRSFLDPEMNVVFPETAGEPDPDALCHFRLRD